MQIGLGIGLTAQRRRRRFSFADLFTSGGGFIYPLAPGTLWQDAAGTLLVTADGQQVGFAQDLSGGPQVAGWSPSTLFSAPEPGVWLDPSDLSTLFQDAGGTIPVTAAGQPVGRALDKSGHGNHATQPVSSARPTLIQDETGKYCLSFDGVDDHLVTPTITPGVDQAQVFAGLRKLSDAATGIIAELSVNAGSNGGAFYMAAPLSDGVAEYAFLVGGSGLNSRRYAGYAAPLTNVVSASLQTVAANSDAAQDVRVNGVDVAGVQVLTAASTGNFGNYPLYIGRRGSLTLPFNGRLYGMIVRFGPYLTTSQIEQAETWMNGKTGAYVPGNHAIQSGAASTRPTYREGPVRLSLDGIDDKLLTSWRPTPAGTIGCMFRTDSAASRILIGSAGATDGRCYLGIGSDGRLSGGIGTQAMAVIAGGSDLRGTGWHSGIMSWDGATARLYLDGAEVYSAAQAGAVNTTIPMMVGALNANGAPGSFFLGDILPNPVALDYAATAAQITSLHRAWSMQQ